MPTHVNKQVVEDFLIYSMLINIQKKNQKQQVPALNASSVFHTVLNAEVSYKEN